MATWAYYLNRAGSSASALTNAQSFFWDLGQILIDAATLRSAGSRWSILSSNNYASQGALTWNTAGSAHSWVCYQSPSTFTANGASKYLVIDHVANTTTNYGEVTVTLHSSAPTGGTTTVAPTSANVINTGIIQWHYSGVSGGTSYSGHSISIITDSAGAGGFYAFQHGTNPTTNYYKSGFLYLPCADLETISAVSYQHGAVFQYFNSTRVLSSICGSIGGLCYINYFGHNHDGTPTNNLYGGVKTNTLISASAPIAGYNTTGTGGLGGISGAEQIEIYNTSSGKVARVGVLPDFLATGAILPHNTPDVVGSVTKTTHNNTAASTAGHTVWLPANNAF